MSQISSKHKEKHVRAIGDHHKFFSRIKKTLYYGKLPKTDRFSLPVTELTADLFSQAKIGHSLERLHCNDAAKISRNACVSPCSLVLAMLYLDRLKKFNPDYLNRVAPSELFLVSLMVSNKFLYDDGEEDEVFNDEWASSGGVTVKELIQMEKDFLNAIKWEIYVNEVSFWNKLKALEIMLAKKEGFARGWFTYTELDVLVENVHFQKLFQIVASLFAILLTAYTAGLLTIIGSMFIVSNIPGNCLQNRAIQFENNKTSLAVVNDAIREFEYDANIFEDEMGINSLIQSQTFKKTLDAVDVLQAGIILASIQPHENIGAYLQNTNSSEDDLNNNAEYITWNWWNSPTMEWLAKTSKLIEKFDFLPNYNLNENYFQVYNMYDKKIDLQDQVHRATKVRIQDQMEMSWHIEWTDTIKNNLLNYSPLYYFQDLIS